MNLYKQLSVFNDITFVEKTHEYFIKGHQAKNPSVTNIIKRFKQPFDVNAAASRVSHRTGEPRELIKLEWELKNKTSTSLGSILHKYIENSYNNKKIAIEKELISANLGDVEKQILLNSLPVLVNQVKNFLSSSNYIHSVKNELVIGDVSDTQICGMIDMLAYNSETDRYEILDFKTNKKIASKSLYNQFLREPFSDISDCEIGQYTIQLNIYQYILTKCADIDIDKRKIIWFNANNKDFVTYELDNIQSTIHCLFEEFIKERKK